MNMAFQKRNLAKCFWWLPHECRQVEYDQASLTVSIIAVQIFPKTFWRFWSQHSWHLKSFESLSQEWFCLSYFESSQNDAKTMSCFDSNIFPPKPKNDEQEKEFLRLLWTQALWNVWFYRCCWLAFGVLKTKPEWKDREGFWTCSRETANTWLAGSGGAAMELAGRQPWRPKRFMNGAK